MKKSRKKHPLAINGMHHVSLRVHDMERSLAFYRDILGFYPKTSFLLDGLRFAMLETGNDVYIELVEMKQPMQSVGERKCSGTLRCAPIISRNRWRLP